MAEKKLTELKVEASLLQDYAKALRELSDALPVEKRKSYHLDESTDALADFIKQRITELKGKKKDE